MSIFPHMAGSRPHFHSSNPASAQVNCFACETIAPVRFDFPEVIHGKT